ncbi:MAG: hypothetical protein KAX49_05820, partial [Halanaerobiales bacterium]|nr:hypothetical protein [Halanaerobiales bacterium]
MTGIASATWDWTDDYAYTDWDNNPIPAPWLAKHHCGVDLTDSYRCPASDDWHLYVKRFTQDDWYSSSGVIKEEPTPRSTIQQNYPYFKLYNKNTGIKDGSDIPHNVGLFLNECGPISYSYADKNEELNEDKVLILKAIYKKWFVFDYMLSYEPILSTNPPSNIFFVVDLGAKDVSDISLSGEFEFDANSVFSNGTNTSKSLIDTIFGCAGQISKQIKNVDNNLEILPFYTQ